MAKALSLDLRGRVVAAVAGARRKSTGRFFACGADGSGRSDAASTSGAAQNRSNRAARQVADPPARAILPGATKDMLRNAPEFKFGE
jgi:hypothetical protein